MTLILAVRAAHSLTRTLPAKGPEKEKDDGSFLQTLLVLSLIG